MPSNSDCILFDLDGVLVDSRAAISGCINHALVEHGFSAWPEKDLHHFIGPPLALAFAEMVRRPPDSSLVTSCIGAYRTRYAKAAPRETVVTPGIEAALGELAQRYRLGVATSKPVAFAEPLLTALGLRPYFAAVAGPDMSVQGESKARTIGASLRMLGSPEHSVMVGDRSHDIDGARAHSLPSIGVTWGMGSSDELRKAGASSLVDNPAELPASVSHLLEHGTGRGPAI